MEWSSSGFYKWLSLLCVLDPLPWLAWLWGIFTAWCRPAPAGEIEYGLWQGPYPDGFLPKGVGAVLNVGSRQGPAHVLNHLPVGHYVWLPTHDGVFPGIPWLARCVFFVDYHRREGTHVLVHCEEGVSRSGLVIVAYLMKEHGLSASAALARAQQARPRCRPNPLFVQGLQQWQSYLSRRVG